MLSRDENMNLVKDIVTTRYPQTSIISIEEEESNEFRPNAILVKVDKIPILKHTLVVDETYISHFNNICYRGMKISQETCFGVNFKPLKDCGFCGDSKHVLSQCEAYHGRAGCGKCHKIGHNETNCHDKKAFGFGTTESNIPDKNQSKEKKTKPVAKPPAAAKVSAKERKSVPKSKNKPKLTAKAVDKDGFTTGKKHKKDALGVPLSDTRTICQCNCCA